MENMHLYDAMTEEYLIKISIQSNKIYVSISRSLKYNEDTYEKLKYATINMVKNLFGKVKVVELSNWEFLFE